MLKAKSSSVKGWLYIRPLLGLLVPLCLVPLASWANDTYLAQNYSTANPGSGELAYAPPPAIGAPNTGQFLAPPQLNDLVSRIALYPDDLIGIILPASTYPLQVVQAARYLDAVRSNTTLSPDDSWNNAVVALLNYPDVVNMMNRELSWTERLGQAVIMQQSDVIAAIGQFRAQVQAAGNLRSDERQIVEYQQGAISIRPANPQVIYVPQYEPTQVIVYSSVPAFGYYPRPCPVYYYNYAAGYPSGFTNFWGVSTLFSIGWSSSRLRMYDYDFYDDPRFDRPYNGFFYRRSWHDYDHDGYDGGPSWGGRNNGRGEGHHGGTSRPRERDWEPRPIAVGGRPGRDSDGGRPAPQTAPDLASPTRTIRDGSPRVMQPPGGESSVRRGAPGTPTLAAPASQAVERSGSFSAPGSVSSPSGEAGVRRGVTVMPSPAAGPSQRYERAPSYSPPASLQGPNGTEPMNVRRSRSFDSEPHATSQPQPSLRMRAPAPQPMQREAISMPRYAPSQPAPVRSMRNMDDGRSSARMAPSRPEPRMAPSRPEPRMAPSRAEPRMAPPPRSEPRAAAARSNDGPSATRRGDSRGSRER